MVGHEDTKVKRLARLKLSESRRRDPINYRVGLVVEFHRRARGGFKSGERWTVVDHHQDTEINSLKLAGRRTRKASDLFPGPAPAGPRRSSRGVLPCWTRPEVFR
jgi:hypothetical protein